VETDRRSGLHCEVEVGVGSGVRLKTDANPDGKTDVSTDTETVADESDTEVNTLLLKIIYTGIWYVRLPACRKRASDRAATKSVAARRSFSAACSGSRCRLRGASSASDIDAVTPTYAPSRCVDVAGRGSSRSDGWPRSSMVQGHHRAHSQNGVCQLWRTHADLTASVNVSQISDSAAQRPNAATAAT
jgi:hypothetical protein